MRKKLMTGISFMVVGAVVLVVGILLVIKGVNATIDSLGATSDGMNLIFIGGACCIIFLITFIMGVFLLLKIKKAQRLQQKYSNH